MGGLGVLLPRPGQRRRVSATSVMLKNPIGPTTPTATVQHVPPTASSEPPGTHGCSTEGLGLRKGASGGEAELGGQSWGGRDFGARGLPRGFAGSVFGCVGRSRSPLKPDKLRGSVWNGPNQFGGRCFHQHCSPGPTAHPGLGGLPGVDPTGCDPPAEPSAGQEAAQDLLL